MLTEVFINKYKNSLIQAVETLNKESIKRLNDIQIYYDHKDHVYKYVHITSFKSAELSIISLLRIDSEDEIDSESLVRILNDMRDEK